MTLLVATGQATSLDGREAAIQATRQALEHLGKKTVAFGLVVASHHFQFQQILSGINPLLGDTPLLGFGTTSEYTSTGVTSRSVGVTLVSGDELQARADWGPGFDLDSGEVALKMIQALQLHQAEGTLLVVTDGLNGDAQKLCEALPSGNYQLAGCLAGGDFRRGYTAQIGGKKAGSGGLAAALLSGDFAIGIGFSHAWQPVGAYFTITSTDGLRVLTLDNLPAHETYARMFGYTPKEWTAPPLNELARLYPLGLEQAGQSGLLIRSPLRIEVDGSLRMHTSIPAGSVGHLMVGGIERCLNSAVDATHQALEKLGDARPVLALVFADIAIQILLEAQPGSELEAVQSILGPQVPVIGGYTNGQIVKTDAGNPELLNQHICVIVLGEKYA
jgi:hypothetical protein